MAKLTKLSRHAGKRDRMINGREYFGKYEREMHIDSMPADKVEQLDSSGLKRGASESKRGGRITRDLKKLPPEETASRRRRSEAFLKKPAQHVPSEDQD